MTTLTVTSKGQVTLKKDLLRHLRVEPGELIEVIELPGGRIELRAARPAGNIEGFIGLLAGKSGNMASLEDLEEAAAKGWAGQE